MFAHSKMSNSTTDRSEDVTDFLQRIKEIGERRDQEDEERNRKLEEEILHGRKERQARRAERAKSISPTKFCPVTTPTTSPTPKADDPRRDTAFDDAMERLTGNSTSPTKENISPRGIGRVSADLVEREIKSKPSPSAAMPSRASALSWQQRRSDSQASDYPRIRPLSIVAAENTGEFVTATPDTSSEEPTASREKIAHSLASKDSTRFNGVTDRDSNSPALRQNQVEDEEGSDEGSNTRFQIPGMSFKDPRPATTIDKLVERSTSPSRSGMVGGVTKNSYQASSGAMGSPIPLSAAQRLDPPSELRSESRSLSMSPSRGRISPDRLDRPVSPTKGIGGFVQSAMMKRSDSVSKRWSVQSPTGPGKGDSVASNCGSSDLSINPTDIAAGSKNLREEDSPCPTSRPSSGHRNATPTQQIPDYSNAAKRNTVMSTTSETFERASVSAPRSESSFGLRFSSAESQRGETTPPVSPSKTMDSRRWSPTKSSWLEAALKKPESPKPKVQSPPQQPAWMSGINKAKQSRGVDLNRNPTIAPKHEVSIGGLMRSPPMGMHAKVSSVGALPAGFIATTVAKGRSSIFASLESHESSDSTPDIARSLNAKLPATINKSKSETPLQKDFRANLRPRQLPPGSNGANEPEFKNLFSQLRPTKTQNYVAPDELQNNITRGKAALNFTGGPKKTERKDEFKEAILKKKQDFKNAQLEGKGVTRSPGGSHDAALPEALAKRKTLTRSDSIILQPLTTFMPQPTPRTIEQPTMQKHNEIDASRNFQSKEIPGKLANRLNPALAGLLARGPPSIGSETSRSLSPALSQILPNQSTSSTENTKGPQLTHMTKGRARRPPRKVPLSALVPPTVSGQDFETQTISNSATEFPEKIASTEIKSGLEAVESDPEPKKDNIASPISQPPSPRKLDLKRRSQFLQELSIENSKSEPVLDFPRPLSPAKKANSIEIPVKLQAPKLEKETQQLESQHRSPTKVHALDKATLSEVSDTPSSKTSKFHSLPSSPTRNRPLVHKSSPAGEVDAHLQNANTASNLKAFDKTIISSTSVMEVVAHSAQHPRGDLVESPSSAISPTELPRNTYPDAANLNASPRAKSLLKQTESADIGVIRTCPKPSLGGLMSLPPSAGRTVDTSTSNSPQSSETSNMLAVFFCEKKEKRQFSFDSAGLLAARQDQEINIKTLRSALYQISNDGKKQRVPSHQERVLFEGNTYLCTHTFVDATDKNATEIYFWKGDQVPNEVAEEAETVAQLEAKAYGCNLIKFCQGNETPEFFNALGGIIIVRRGSSNKYDSLAPHILCGRKYFGQIVFDEVDYSPRSLCSGFPYLISSQSGKCYLWKGKGSAIEELSCARLVGMDFGLTGEIEEVEDGKESQSFLQIFGTDAQIPKSADHWRMKPNYSKYSVRLFVAQAEAREEIKEMSPFCQNDLETGKIYVLDAFFEIYIIVGSSSQSQYAAFQNSLMFAQEYGILAAGMEDRPFVPVTTVVLEGVPKDMKAVFRKWTDSLSPTYREPPPTNSLQRWRSLRVLPLTAALEATMN